MSEYGYSRRPADALPGASIRDVPKPEIMRPPALGAARSIPKLAQDLAIELGNIIVPYLAVTELSAIVADLGTVIAGLINNAASNPTAGIRIDSAASKPGTWTRYLDLGGSGTDPFLKHESFEILYDGTARFNGKVYWADNSEYVAASDLYNVAIISFMLGM